MYVLEKAAFTLIPQLRASQHWTCENRAISRTWHWALIPVPLKWNFFLGLGRGWEGHVPARRCRRRSTREQVATMPKILAGEREVNGRSQQKIKFSISCQTLSFKKQEQDMALLYLPGVSICGDLRNNILCDFSEIRQWLRSLLQMKNLTSGRTGCPHFCSAHPN